MEIPGSMGTARNRTTSRGEAPVTQRLDSFEAWAGSLEAAGLNFDPATRRWTLLKSDGSRDRAIRLEHVTLIFRRSKVQAEQLRISVDLRKWGRMAQNAAKETFGSRTRAEIHVLRKDGRPDGVWAVMEFARPASREANLGYSSLFEHRGFQSGFIAVQLEINATPSTTTIRTTRIAALGYLPVDLWRKMPRFIRRSLGLPGTSRIEDSPSHEPDDFVVRIRTAELLGSRELAASQRLHETLREQEDQTNSGITHHLPQSFDHDGNIMWEHLSSPQAEGTFATTAPNQQQLDSHEPDFSSARSAIDALKIRIARQLVGEQQPANNSEAPLETEDTGPTTRSLVLSLRARECLLAGNYTEALDAVSKLVRSIHADWDGITNSPIASTILHEVIGDCWAAQPPGSHHGQDTYKLATTAWERAGAMRANRLRILRKLAFAARAHGLIDAEIEALTEIIQREKRRHELARSMIRLAQIRIETGNPGVHMTPDQLLLQASRLGGDDEQVNFACFQQLVANGNFSAAWEFGNKLTTGPGLLRSSVPRAEVFNTLGHLAWSEFSDDDAAIRLFRLARMEDPAARLPLQGLATLASRTGNHTLEQETLLELFGMLVASRKSEIAESPDSTPALEGIARRVLEISYTHGSQNTLRTIVILELLENTFTQPIKTNMPRGAWLELLRWLTLRDDSRELTPSISKAFAHLAAQTMQSGVMSANTDTQGAETEKKIIMAIVATLLNPRDIDAGKSLLEATFSLLGVPTGNKGPTLPDTDAVALFAERLCLGTENDDWLAMHASSFFRILPHQINTAVVLEALRHRDMSSAAWLHPALEAALDSYPVTDDSVESGEQQTRIADLVNLVATGLQFFIKARKFDSASLTLTTILCRNPGIATIVCDTIDSWDQGSHRDHGLELLARVFTGETKTLTGEVFPVTHLNSRIRGIALRHIARDPAAVRNSAALDRLYVSAVRDGQTLPLEEIETSLVVERMGNKPTPESLRCLIHQAIICDDVATASEWFKVCLDHALLKGGDEVLGARIITSWLASLKPANRPTTREENPEKAGKIEEIAAELIAILKEIDPQRADSISAQLENAGFIQPADPVPAIAGAVLAGKVSTAKKLFVRTVDAMPGTRAELANRLFTIMDQMEPQPGTNRIQRTGIIELLLDWFSEQAGVKNIPVTLALLTAKHLENRTKARSIVEEVLNTLQAKHSDDPRLWIPLYMLLQETASPDEVRIYMDRILPQLKAQPDALADYPFTVESLEAEQELRIHETTRESAGDTYQSVPEIALEEPVTLIHESPEFVDETPTQPAIEVSEPANDQPITLNFDTFEAAPEPVVEAAPEPVVEAAPNPIIETPVIPAAPPTEFDWRSAVRNRKLLPGMTQKILEAPMRNKIEKHVALQTVAVMRGEAATLDRWDWRVWRKPAEYGYSRQGRERFPPGLSPRIMKTPGFKLLLRASPFLALSFPERFTLSGLAKSLGMTIKQLQAKRERIEWATGFPGHAGFNFHAKLFADRGLQLFSLAGLGPQIFYDATSKAVYIDDAYFVRKPPTHLYHRVMFLLYSLRTQFHPLLQLHPEKQILPELKKLKTVIDGGPLSILAARVKLSDSRVAKLMKAQDFEEFKVLFEKASEITLDDIIDANKAMQQYVWRLLLADSLDLTGIIEAMLDIDLLLPGSVKPGEVLLMSSQVDPLMNFALALKLDAQT